ncbi:MAG: N-acetyltransferase family protein [Eubacteriales bacterium]
MFYIRKAVPEDALGITIVNVYTWEATYSGLISDIIIDTRIKELQVRASKCKQNIENNGHMFVATMDKVITGFCAYGESRNEDYKDSGEIYGLYVLMGCQGMMIGKSLFLAAVKELILEGYNSMIINCLQNNPAIHFLQTHGRNSCWAKTRSNSGQFHL